MASGGLSGRAGSSARSFDFGSDDVLCSYDDYGVQDASNGRASDSSVKDFHESRMGRPLVSVYSQEDFAKEDVISAVEKCMKKYADNLLRFLEGISGRLSQLEVYCYKLERSVGELRADLVHGQCEVDAKLKLLEKHLQEVHRSVQIIRDKQELAEAQKELTKLQLVQKEATNISHSKRNEEGAAPSVSQSKKQDSVDDVPNQHLALALPHQIPPASAGVPEQNQPYTEPALQQPAPVSTNVQADRYILNQASTLYPQQMQPEYQYLQPGPQMKDLSAQVQPQQLQVINQSQPQPLPQYQQQWHQHIQPPMVQAQAPSQAQIRPQTPPTYPTYQPNQPVNPTPDTFPGGSPVQAPYSVTPPTGNRPEAMPYAYGGPGSSVSQTQIPRQPLPQISQTVQPSLSKGGYMGPSPYGPVAPQNNIEGYSPLYNVGGSRVPHSQNLQSGSYPPSNISALQNQQLPPGSNIGLHHPGLQPMRSHPFAEMIEKAVNMGYSRDHVVSVIHRMAESGQTVDFNALLDRLNTRSSGASPRVWSS